MKNAFIEYALDNERTYSYSSYDTFSEISGTKTIRSGEDNVMTVKDCDRFKNVDEFTINSTFRFSMIKSAYKYLDIEVTCDVKKKIREIDIFIFIQKKQ